MTRPVFHSLVVCWLVAQIDKLASALAEGEAVVHCCSEIDDVHDFGFFTLTLLTMMSIGVDVLLMLSRGMHACM